MKDDIGYKILIGVIVVLIFIAYREGDRKVELAEENNSLKEQIEELQLKIDDLQTENNSLYEHISELESLLEDAQ
jgi:cell division protein FtsB